MERYEAYKDSGVEWIGEIPTGWGLQRLEHFIVSIDSGVSVNSASYPASADEVGVLKTSAVYHGIFNASENKLVNSDELDRVKCPVYGDKLIVSRMNTPEWVGACGYTYVSHPNLKLQWLCSFHNGDRGVNYPSGNDFQDQGVPFYGADALIADIADISSARFITRERYNAMGGLKIKELDTLYTLRGSTIGKNAIVIQPEGTVASFLMGIRVRRSDLIDPWYLHYWLNSHQEFQQRDACINGSTAPNLSAEDVAHYRMPLPPYEQQRRAVKEIKERTDYVDGLISAKQSMANKLREYRRSLISEAVTGKFKVPGV